MDKDTILEACAQYIKTYEQLLGQWTKSKKNILAIQEYVKTGNVAQGIILDILKEAGIIESARMKKEAGIIESARMKKAERYILFDFESSLYGDFKVLYPLKDSDSIYLLDPDTGYDLVLKETFQIVYPAMAEVIDRYFKGETTCII